MSFWTAIVVLAAIVAIYSLKRHRDQVRYGNSVGDGADDRGSSAREAELKREIQELHERVKVLERIVTDGREARAIAEEIESLRGK